MRSRDRANYLKKAPKLFWDIFFLGRYEFKYDLIPIHKPQMPRAKRFNLLKTGGNLVYRRAHVWGWPIHMHIELTNYCNLQCRVCPTGTNMLSRRQIAMEPALVERLMDEVGPYLLTASLWGWGESLLHPELGDILRIASNRGVTTLLSTNGQNLDDERVLQSLIDYPPNYLIVCIDGLTDETNRIFRAGAKLDPILTGVRRLAQMKHQRGQPLPILHFRYIVMKHNEHELPQLPEFAAKNRFDQLTIRSLCIIDTTEDTHRALIPSDERFRAYTYEQEQRIARTDFICEKAFTSPAVFADGTVVACEQDYNAQLPYGKLDNNSSFADIWWSKHAAEVRKSIRDHPKDLSFCRSCPFKDRMVSTGSIEYFQLEKVEGDSE